MRWACNPVPLSFSAGRGRSGRGLALKPILRGGVKVAVDDRRRVAGVAQGAGDALGAMDRAVAAAGAAEGDGDIALSLGAVAGKQGEQQRLDLRQRRLIGGIGGESGRA